MRALTIIGLGIGGIFLIFLAIGLLAPKKMETDQSVLIKAHPNTVYKQLLSFEKRNTWSPWSKLDPDMVTEISGTDGEVGAIYKWSGNDMVGKGEQEIMRIDPMKQIDTKLRFIAPWESEADTWLSMEEKEGGVEVHWVFSSEAPFPTNALSFLMGMENAIGNDFAKGLAELKTICEEEASRTFRGFEILEVDVPAKNYVGVRAVNKLSQIQSFYGTHWPALYGHLQSQKAEMLGMPSGMFYSWEPEKGQADMVAAIPVKGEVDLANGKYESFPTKAGKVLMIDYYGDHEKMTEAHEAMYDYMKAHNMTHIAPTVEEFLTNPEQEPDPSKWLTKIYYYLE